MILLNNNCRIGKLSVTPKNWDSKPDISVDWYVTYWFYDDNLKQRKQIKIRGMNHLKTVKDRQNQTHALIDKELYLLKERGYNPITNTYEVSDPEDGILSPKTEFIRALRLAFGNITVAKSTMADLEVIIDNVEAGAKKLHLETVPIYDIKKRDIRAIFDYLSKEHSWSGHSYNKYRSYLMILFGELSEYDAVESNIPRELKKTENY